MALMFSKSAILKRQVPATSFSMWSYALGLFAMAAAIPLATYDPLWLGYLGAVLCGWSEVDGRCGHSHMGTLTPLRRSPSPPNLWLRAVSAYSISGSVTSALVGLLLGQVGALVQFSRSMPFALLAICGVLIVRELGWLRVPLPQVDRQTHKGWAISFGVVTASGMWGAHIGLGFATVIQHGGLFAIAALAAAQGPMYGVAVLMFFWLGRVLPLWLAALLPASSCDGPEVGDDVMADRRAYRYTAIVGLACVALSCFL